MIHPTAIIDDANIADDVEIGPYVVIGKGVTIDSGCKIDAHVNINGPTYIGKNNHFYSHCSVGNDPQDKKYHGEVESELHIGNNNTIREYVTINRGSKAGHGKTMIGDDNWIMAYVHVAHDCIVGHHNVFASGVMLAGHITIYDHVSIGGLCGLRQFCKLGDHSFISGLSGIVKDVPPYMLVDSNKAKKAVGINLEGLKRCGFEPTTISLLQRAYKIIYRQNLTIKAALAELNKLSSDSIEIQKLYDFIANTKLGIIR